MLHARSRRQQNQLTLNKWSVAMSLELHDPAQAHIDAIYRLNDYLIEIFPDRYDTEMDNHIRTLLQSFDDFRGIKRQYPHPRDTLYDDSLGRNYITAQCSLLLAFASRVTGLAEAQNDEQLQKLLAELRTELKLKYSMFFSREFPRDDE
jgi:hypothetical protein